MEAKGRGAIEHESRGKEDDKHIEHTLSGVFDVFVVRGGIEENVKHVEHTLRDMRGVRSTSNMPLGHVRRAQREGGG